MAELFICRKGAITAQSVTDLRKAGVVVVEATDPGAWQFIRAGQVVSQDDLFWAAMRALNHDNQNAGGVQRRVFVEMLTDLMDKSQSKKATV